MKVFNRVVSNMKRAAPTWESASKNQTDQLYLFNSLTKQKVNIFYLNIRSEIENFIFYILFKKGTVYTNKWKTH